jgi:tetratricopeptide (TPR) repeat protein
MKRFVAVAILAAACLTACTSPHLDSDSEPKVLGNGGARAADILVFPPAGQDRIRTTSGPVFLGNLQATIEVQSQRLVQRPSPTLERFLANQLLLRFQILGRLEDLERADELIRHPQNDRPNPETMLLQGRVDAAFHRFSGALDVIDQLSTDHPDLAASLHGLRTSILRAQGQIDEWTPMPGARPTMESLTGEAIALLDKGRLNDAMVRFHLAERAYGDTSPFPLALLHTRIGIGYLRYGHLKSARLLLESALSRLPDLVIAKDHLAETLVRLGDTETAIKLYRELVKSTADPEFCGVLEGLLSDRKEQDHFRQCAREGFAYRLATHPEAYWNHAAEYFMAQGEPARALELATANAKLRSDASSLILMARAAQANDDTETVCRIRGALQSRELNPPELAEFERSNCVM